MSERLRESFAARFSMASNAGLLTLMLTAMRGSAMHYIVPFCGATGCAYAAGHMTILTCGLWLPVWAIAAYAHSVSRGRKVKTTYR